MQNLKTELLYKYYQQFPAVQTDTRKLQEGDFFFALKGPNFNGNTFAGHALEKGAAYAVVDEKQASDDPRIILVDDVLPALQQLAHHHRKQFDIPFIAITGSNGKTTTKELMNSVLATTYRTYATEGNLNNHIGIPLTLLRIKPGIEMAVIEMGANHQKEIESYCKIVQPTHGIITNVGKAHLEGFGGIAGVRKGKGELFDFLRANRGTAFACKDFDYLREMSQGISEVVWYGTSKNEYVNGNITDAFPYLSAKINFTGEIKTHLVGGYNLYNVLAAVTAGKYFKVSSTKVKRSIASYLPGNARSEWLKRGNNLYILDTYNANPTSMKAAIENFAAAKGNKKVLMLGAMMELGAESLNEHQRLVDLIRKFPWKQVVLVGGDFTQVDHPFLYLPDSNAAREWFQEQH